MNPKDWTPEQIQNASTYGVCWACGEPRTSFAVEVVEDAGTVLLPDTRPPTNARRYVTRRRTVVCPNGHAA